jgi:hypothetical protein
MPTNLAGKIDTKGPLAGEYIRILKGFQVFSTFNESSQNELNERTFRATRDIECINIIVFNRTLNLETPCENEANLND